MSTAERPMMCRPKEGMWTLKLHIPGLSLLARGLGEPAFSIMLIILSNFLGLCGCVAWC